MLNCLPFQKTTSRPFMGSGKATYRGPIVHGMSLISTPGELLTQRGRRFMTRTQRATSTADPAVHRQES
jgi:hypothetical protein